MSQVRRDLKQYKNMHIYACSSIFQILYEFWTICFRITKKSWWNVSYVSASQLSLQVFRFGWLVFSSAVVAFSPVSTYSTGLCSKDFSVQAADKGTLLSLLPNALEQLLDRQPWSNSTPKVIKPVFLTSLYIQNFNPFATTLLCA